MVLEVFKASASGVLTISDLGCRDLEVKSVLGNTPCICAQTRP